jgi:hypothetical protein
LKAKQRLALVPIQNGDVHTIARRRFAFGLIGHGLI